MIGKPKSSAIGAGPIIGTVTRMPKPAVKRTGGFNAGLTKPSDAGRTSAALGGKGSSNGKGR